MKTRSCLYVNRGDPNIVCLFFFLRKKTCNKVNERDSP